MPTARCSQDSKKKQLVTRSALQRLRCCVCHLHHEEAMKTPHNVLQFFAKVLKKVQHYKVDVIAGDAIAASYQDYKRQEYQDLYNSSVAVMFREMQREINMGRPFESRLHIGNSTNHNHSQLRSADDFDGCCVASLSWRKPPGPRIMRKLWSNTCEPTQNKEKERAEDSPYTKAIEAMLKETARKSFPDLENIGNPMIAPQDYEVRQSGRVLELHNRDLWIRPTDLSWHFPILVTIRELPFKTYW